MKKLVYSVVTAVAVFTACKQEPFQLYDDLSRLQFGPTPDRIYTTSYDMADTLKPYTFYYKEESDIQDTVYFDIYAIGRTQNTDKAFELEQVQVPDKHNAIPGVHYVAFDDPKVSKFYVIKAGSSHTKVPIIVMRDPSLKTTTTELKFKIVANENFQLGEQNKIWRRLEITDRLIQPELWNANFIRNFGKYSVVKHSFMIEATGMRWDDDFLKYLNATGGLPLYYRIFLTTALADYNNANPGNPLTDEDEELVVFP